jgi:hypothetical protein
MLSTSYSYICTAVAASLQMGLFSEAAEKDVPEDQKARRRAIFSVLSIVDTYITTSLGLPRTLRDIHPDRSLPCAMQPTDIHDPMYSTYIHAQLIQILAETVETNHPFTRPISSQNGTYGVEYSKVIATEVRPSFPHLMLGLLISCAASSKSLRRGSTNCSNIRQTKALRRMEIL